MSSFALLSKVAAHAPASVGGGSALSECVWRMCRWAAGRACVRYDRGNLLAVYTGLFVGQAEGLDPSQPGSLKTPAEAPMRTWFTFPRCLSVLGFGTQGQFSSGFLVWAKPVKLSKSVQWINSQGAQQERLWLFEGYLERNSPGARRL